MILRFLCCAYLAMMVFVFSLTTASVATANPMGVSYNSQESYYDVPLVVLRFNKQKIYFQKQLYNAMSKAVAIKPTLNVELISYVPQGSNHKQNQQRVANAKGELNRVLKSLTNMGVPKNRIRVSTEGTDQIKFHEVHLYVE